MVGNLGRGGCVDVEDVDAMGIRLLEARGVGRVAEPVFAVELERDERGRDASGVGGADHAARGFADAEVGGEEAGDVELGAGVAAGEREREGGEPDGEVEDGLAVGCRDVLDAQLAVLVLAAEPLEERQRGDAAEPGEEVGEPDPAELQRQHGPAARGFRRERHGQFEGAGPGRGDDVGDAAVDEAGERRERGLESARLRVGPEFAAKDDAVEVARRQAQRGRFADPGRIGGEVVEEQAAETRHAPGPGGGRSGAGGRHEEAPKRKARRLPWQSFMRPLRWRRGSRRISPHGGG